MSLAEIRQSGAEHMGEEEVEQFLRDQGVGVLSLPDRDVPYVLPLSFGYDGDAHLYFTYLLFGEQSKKEELSERAKRGRFLVYAAPSMYEWRSVLLTGTISEVPEEEWEELRTAMENAWHPDLFATAAPMRGVKGYRFSITEQTSIKHSTRKRSE
ncbi:MAG: pyridoxamine 5'-phosphate oxidase family protein [Halovenus sp.]